MIGNRLRATRTVTQRALFFLLIVLCAAVESGAHNEGESYLYLQVYPDRLSGRFEMPLADLNHALGFEGTDREITGANLDQRLDFLQRYYLDHVAISSDGRPLEIRFTEHELLRAHDDFALLSFDLGGFDEVPEALTVHYSVLFDEEPGHHGYLLIEHNWATGTFANENQISLVFSPDAPTQDLDLTSSGTWRGFVAVAVLGAKHVWFGFDHLMFLVALLLQTVLHRNENNQWQPLEQLGPALTNVVKIVVALIVAHGVALSLSALGVLRLPERLVEVVIAGSITVVAANILVPLFKDRVWMVVFGFGLFHGLGFAGGLYEMGVLGEHLGLSVLGFNIGVEIGQLVVVAVLFPLLFAVRRTRFYIGVVLPVAAWIMILVSAIWVVERAFGLKFHMTRRVKNLIGGLIS